jgi:hypothetical protein
LSGKTLNAFCKRYFKHGDANPVFGSGREHFDIFGEAEKMTQPGKSAFNHPAFRQHCPASFIFLEMCKGLCKVSVQYVTAVPPSPASAENAFKEGHLSTALSNTSQALFVLRRFAAWTLTNNKLPKLSTTR